jgi:hypothetical protein
MQEEDALETLHRRGVDLLIVGTSDTAEGRLRESAARVAARTLDIPCVVMEDFAGNYYDVPLAPPSVVFVDSEAAAAQVRGKTSGSLLVEIYPCARYDPLRRRIGELRKDSIPDAAAVLWIGQPETEDCLSTLRQLMKALHKHGTPLWFRAHPRDHGYRGGAYHELLRNAGIEVADMTPVALEECLAKRPRLIATQFSSVAIEAGFWGIPAFNILLPDAGGERLLARKGYAVPHWCEEGAAFLATAADQVAPELERALASQSARTDVQASFDRYFAVGEESAPAIINVLYNQGFL